MHTTNLVVVQSWEDGQNASIWTFKLSHPPDLTPSEIAARFRKGMRTFREYTRERKIFPKGWDGERNHSETLNTFYPWFTVLDAVEEQPLLLAQHLYAQGLLFDETVSVVVDNDDFSDDTQYRRPHDNT